MYVKKLTSFCQALKKIHTEENWFLFFCLTVYIVLSHLHCFNACFPGERERAISPSVSSSTCAEESFCG